MPLYTFVANYKGGTYISQINASSPREALFAWATNLTVSEMSDFGPRCKAILLQALQEDEEDGILFAPLTSIINGWCSTPYVRGKCMFVNFFKTDPNVSL